MVWALSLSTTELSSRSLTPEFSIYGIRSLIDVGNLVRPLNHSVLYPHISSLKASPKAISRRTSYLWVRLEFLRYPQFIRCLFNDNQFGPPLDFTLASSWPWIGHSVSGLLYMTYFSPFSDSISLRLRISLMLNLAIYNNSPDRSTKSTISHINSALSACKHRVSNSISLPSRGSFHLSLTVLLHYRSPSSI